MFDPPNRRAVLTALIAASSFALFTAHMAQAAMTEGDAAALIQTVSADLNAIVSGSAAASPAQFERILDRYADMPIIAQTVLGVDWRSASDAQRRGFTQALRGYLARKYGARFHEFEGGSIEVTGARPIRSFFEVRSRARLAGQSPVEVIWLVSDGSGQPRIFNILIEGIDLRSTEGQEMRSILDANGGSIDALIAALNAS